MAARAAALILLIVLFVGACAQQEPRQSLDEVMAEWNETINETFVALTQLDEEQFVAAWAAERDRWASAIRRAGPAAEGSSLTKARAAVSVTYSWGTGILAYEPYHQNFLRDGSFRVSEGFLGQLGALQLDAPAYLDIEEYTDFLWRYVRNLWNARVEAPRFGATGIRDTAARLEIAREFEGQAVQCHLRARALEQHFEDFEADGLSTEVDAFLADCPGEEAGALSATFADLIAERDGHRVEIYHSVDGFNLEAHIYAPDAPSEPKPMVVWMHGGGWLTGSWSWCGPFVFFKDAGYPVVQVEYRLRGRHGTNVGDALADTLAAVQFAREHAEAMGGDPEKVILAGFSAGGHLSMAAGALATPGDPTRPDLVVSLSGCTLLESDFEVRMSGSKDQAEALSPLLHVDGQEPPLLMVNARTDHLCAFENAEAYLRALSGSGADATFLPVDEGGHFFLRDPSNVEPTRAAVLAFLTARGF